MQGRCLGKGAHQAQMGGLSPSPRGALAGTVGVKGMASSTFANSRRPESACYASLGKGFLSELADAKLTYTADTIFLILTQI